MQELPEYLAEEQTAAAGAWAEVEHPVAGRFKTVNTPFRIHGTTMGPQGAAPEPGQHTDALLASVGYSAAEIAGLRGRKVVGAQLPKGSPIARWSAEVERRSRL